MYTANVLYVLGVHSTHGQRRNCLPNVLCQFRTATLPLLNAIGFYFCQELNLAKLTKSRKKIENLIQNNFLPGVEMYRIMSRDGPGIEMFRIMSRDGQHRSENGDSLEFENLTELINAHPQSAELSVSFTKPHLEALLLECGSPQVALKKLSTCLKAYEGLKKMEQKMLVRLHHFAIMR